MFNIDGHRLFTMGGAGPKDNEFKIEGVNWWKEEIPNDKEIDEGLSNLDKNNWEVDYVLTHTGPLEIIEKIGYKKDNNYFDNFLNILERGLKYKHWYFGHFHRNIEFDKHTMLYNEIIQIKK